MGLLASASVAAGPQVVVLDCPADVSLGTLVINFFKRDPATGRRITTKKKVQLKGTVSVPIGMHTNFKLSYAGADRIKKLADVIGKYEVMRSFDCDTQPLNDAKIAQIARISSIKRLDLAHTDISDSGVKILTALNDLREINLSSTTITTRGVRYLPSFPKLKLIDLDKNSLDDSIGKELSKLTSVEDLGIKATKVSDACLIEIAKMKTITHLRIGSNNGITDDGLKKLVTLKNLTLLDVTDSKVTAKGLEVFKPMPIKVLKLRVKSFTKAQLDRLKTIFPRAEIKDGSRDTNIDHSLFEPLHSPFEKGPQF